MKKFFEEHDLFKLAGIMMLISAILSWILVYSYYSSGSLTVFTDSTMVGLTRSIFDESTVGIFDFNTYGLLSLYYFTITFVYVAVVAGFYKFLGSLNAYKKLTDKVADVFKGKEKLFIAISILLYAVLASLSTDYMSLLVFVPFTITILHKLGMDKITSLISSFGGILLGILGSTYSTKVAGMLVDSTYGIGVSYGYDFVIVLCISVIAYATLLYLTFTRLGKLKKNDKDIVPDMFASEEVEVKKDSKKKSHYVNIVPLAIVLGIVGLIVVLAYIGWSTALGVDAFNNAYTWFTDATLFGYPLFSVLLGTTTFKAFGSWDLFGAASLMIIATIIIKIIYKVPFDTIISEYGNGLKKILKSIILLMMIYAVLIFTVVYPAIPGVINQIDVTLGSVTWLQPVAWVLNGGIATLFTVDFQYTMSLIGSLYATYSNVQAAGFALQAAYGLTAFIAPTSAVLMLGLSMLNIKFKDYFKFIWKFLVAILVVVLVILYIMMFI